MPHYRPPKYCRQREKGRADRAFVRINGKKIKLGVYGSERSLAKYAEVVGLKPGSKLPSPEQPLRVSERPTVSEVMAAYLPHADTYYGHKTPAWYHVRSFMRGLRRLFGSLPAADFKAKKLKELRDHWAAQGWTRTHVNAHTGRLRRMFKWAVSEELLPTETYESLCSVDHLRAGRCDAHDNPPVPPVAIEVVKATIAKLPEVVADMVRVQLFTGVRPGELVRMRPCDIDRSGEVWVYKPPQHKTKHKGKKRAVAIGLRARAILLRYLARAAEACCFQPRDSEARRLAERETNRKTPLSYGNRRGTNRKDNPRRQPGERYTTASYRRAVHRAARRAGVAKWSPHPIRHTRGTEVQKNFGLDSAQAVLGHSNAKTTEIYAELDLQKAIEVARRIG